MVEVLALSSRTSSPETESKAPWGLNLPETHEINLCQHELCPNTGWGVRLLREALSHAIVTLKHMGKEADRGKEDGQNTKKYTRSREKKA